MMTIHTPDQLYGELFTDVQSAHLFGDSKTFVDATPKRDPADILRLYRQQRSQPAFNLKAFVLANFELPSLFNGGATAGPGKNPRQQIEQLWRILAREPDTASRHDSLIPLPNSYIVPGGRFREIYYWDSYFTMLGLAASGHLDKVRDMVDNFAYLIDQVGFIPNGNRSYYCSRSQPPYFALMVELLADESQEQALYAQYLPQLEREYGFWMAGADDLANDGDACRRVIRAGEGYLNRHWDDADIPRQESYAEDMALAARAGRAPGELFRQIRAACESGWDFSSRWFDDPDDMSSINTTQIVPVDLNCCLYKLEAVLAIAHRQAGDQEAAAVFEGRARIRSKTIMARFYCEGQGWFADLRLPNLEYSNAPSLAGAYPLFFGLASPFQAASVSKRLRNDYLKAGGWVTTPVHSGQQWDAPNGWAPLQWIVYRGLVRYGYTEEAEEGARRWVKNNLQLYEKTGKFIEKYDVENPGTLAGGGEYEVQDGFGWTNGVLLKLMDQLGL